MELAGTLPSALPSPAVGTRIAFQLVFPDLRWTNSLPKAPPKYGVKNLGSVVIGGGSEKLDDVHEGRAKDEEGHKTLIDARLVVGDYVSCAILPPLENGSIAPMPLLKAEFGPGVHDGRMNHSAFNTHYSNPPGFPRGGSRDSRSGRGDRSGDVGGFPEGEWRRGEKLPGTRGTRGRGRRNW
jgi:histone deacetylase complex subunit SAP18